MYFEETDGIFNAVWKQLQDLASQNTNDEALLSFVKENIETTLKKLDKIEITCGTIIDFRLSPIYFGVNTSSNELKVIHCFNGMDTKMWNFSCQSPIGKQATIITVSLSIPEYHGIVIIR